MKISSIRIKTTAVFLTLLTLLIPFSLAYAQDWYSAGWPYRKTISIDYTQVAEDLTHFPVLVDFTDTDLQSKAQPDGDDILFTGDDGISKLNHEIEYFDSSSGHLSAWVNLPSLSSSQNTTIEMYYGNVGASSQENPGDVWDNNYKAVHHFSEISGDYLDSTSYGNHGSTVAVTTRTGPGKIGLAPEFDGVDNYVEVPHHTSLDFTGSTITIEVWLNTNDAAKGQAVVSKNLGSGTGTGWNTEVGFQAQDISFQSGEGSSNYLHTDTSQLQDSSWVHGVFIYPESGTGTIFVNGVAQATTGAMGSWTPQNTFLRIGMANPSTDRYPFDGKLDEVRLSNIVRSSAWIQTSYNNMNEPSLFSTRGPEETTGAPVIFSPNPAHETSAILITLEELRFELRDLQGDAIDYIVTTNPDIGSTVEIGAGNGIHTLPISGLAYGTTYTWYVSARDPGGSGEWNEAVFQFTTEFDAPDISGENPADGSAEVPFNPTLSADIHDAQGDSVEWEIWTDANGGSWQMIDSGILPGGVGTVTTSAAGMDQFSTTYYWRVHARDSGSGEWVFETYSFRTLENKMNFAAFTDTHVGSRCDTGWAQADYLDLLGQDVLNQTVPCEFVVNLGDIVHTTTAQLTGVGLPSSCDQYKNNLKAFHIQHLNLPFHIVSGNHDECDYRTNSNDPYKLTRGLINETEANTYPYAMMRNGILFLAIPEMSYIQWTSQYIKEWVEYMVQQYPTSTTIILAHQAIEDTTRHDHDDILYPYRGKQDTDWWAELFRNNAQIKMWIHGHQHWLDWYQGSQSSGRSHPVYDFGHEMVFSHPYSGTDFSNKHEEDRIVIYTISSTGFFTRAWENNGAGGHWVTDYDHEWQIPTTYDENAADWYSYPVFIQDGETQFTDMKVLSSDITLELIGTKPMELFFDEQMSTTSGWAGEVILSFANDQSGVTPNTPGMTVAGPKTITFPPKDYRGATWEDGKSAQPYNFFPMGVSSRAVPGETYQFTLTAKANSGTGTISVAVSASDWGTESQYSTLAGSSETVLSHEFGVNSETVSGTYTVPDTEDAWFLQGSLDFENATNYEVTLFSITRLGETETTDDFGMAISGISYDVPGTLLEDEKVEFTVNPVDLAQSDGVISFSGSIGGNHYGMARLIYHGPILMGRNARFRVNSSSGGMFDVTLTDKVSGWPGSAFKMFPFSMADSALAITASDGSEQQHLSSNGNVWVSSNTPDTNEIDLFITYEALAPAISEESPGDEATDIHLNPNLSARIRDLQSDQVDWEIKTNASGTWETIASGTLPDGEGTVYATPTNMDEYNTTYNWSVSAIDSVGTGELVTKTYRFTTRPGNYIPSISNVTPGDSAINVSLNPTLSVEVSDADGDSMEITFENDAAGPWQVMQTYTNAASGTYAVIPADMNEYGRIYHWRVTADDGKGTVATETYSFTTEIEQGVWWDGSWQYRKEITIDYEKVEEDLPNFPVLIEFTDNEVAAHAQADADDLVFTDYQGVSLSYEIEEYESLSGYLLAWVEVPLLSSNEHTTLYMYYGNSGVDSQEYVEGTWDGSNHVLVQHLGEASGTHYDGTHYHNDSNAVVVIEQDAVGIIEGADEFDGIDNYIRMPHALSVQFGESSFTAQAWIYPRSVSDSGGSRIVNNRGTGGGGSYKGYQLKIKDLGGNWYCGDSAIDDGTGNYKAYSGTTPYGYNQWYHLVMVYEADNELRFYVNGELDGTLFVGPYGDITNSLPTAIGASLADQGIEGADDRQYFDGIIDEVRLTETARSLGWITTEFNNQSNPSTFFILGDEETQGIGCTSHGDCGFCEKCEGGACILQSGEDLREECPDESCTTGLCDGTGACGVEPDTSVCRPATGGCDVQETCDGVSADCPDDAYLPAGATCRSAVDGCDFTENCTGSSPACPADQFEPDGTICDDVLYCTLTDQCESGQCIGFDNPCTPPLVCNESNDHCEEIISGSWWNGAWPYRKSYTIDTARIDEDLAGFPALIDLTDIEVAAHAQSSGDDIIFTDINGNALSHEIELYNDVSGHLIAWVNVPLLSSTEDTTLYIYFGNTDATNQEDVEGTWNSGYMMVQHLDETTGTHYDSTGNANNGTAEMGIEQDATGIIQGADGFDGIDDYVDCGNGSSLQITGSITVETWVVSTGGTGSNRVLAKDKTQEVGKFILWRNPQGDLAFIVADSGDTWHRAIGGPITDEEWIYVVGVYDTDNQQVRLYKDGTLVAEVDGPGSLNLTGEVVTIGSSSNNEQNWNGTIDEVRISNVARSEGWIQTSYNNQGDPVSFAELGDIEIQCEGNFDCDYDCDGSDATIFKNNFGRSEFINPCESGNPCNGNFDCDADVDGSDAQIFKQDFGRSPFSNPCPPCVAGEWCSY